MTLAEKEKKFEQELERVEIGPSSEVVERLRSLPFIW